MEYTFNIPEDFERKLINFFKQKYGRDVRLTFGKVKVTVKQPKKNGIR